VELIRATESCEWREAARHNRVGGSSSSPLGRGPKGAD